MRAPITCSTALFGTTYSATPIGIIIASAPLFVSPYSNQIRLNNRPGHLLNLVVCSLHVILLWGVGGVFTVRYDSLNPK